MQGSTLLQTIMNSSLDHFLRTNIEPNADEKTRAQRAVDDKTHEISEIGSAIDHLNAAVWTLYERRAKLWTELEQLKSVLSPIRRVPLDLIGEIFLLLRPSLGPRGEGTPIPWALAIVCRSWRETALGISRLWSVLDMADFLRPAVIQRGPRGAVIHHRRKVHDEGDDNVFTPQITAEQSAEEDEGFQLEDVADRLQTCLARSRNHGLAICVHNNPARPPAFALLFEALIKEAFRWESLMLLSPPFELCQRLMAIKHQFGRLRRLAYDWGNTFRTTWDYNMFGPERAPNLVEFEVQYLRTTPTGFHRLPVSWSNLKRLRETHCDIALQERVAVYRQLTNLLFLHLELSSHLSLDDTALSFPNLRVGWFHFMTGFPDPSWHPSTTLLARFDMPMLEELVIQGQNTNALTQFMPQFSPQLQKLSLVFGLIINYHSPDDTERVLALYPNLRHLSLWGPHYLSEETLRCLTPGQTLDDKVLLPKLETLCISSHSFVPEECQWTTLLEMVRGRFDPPAETAVSRLRKFHLAYDAGDSWHGGEVWDEHVGRGLSALAKRTGWDIQADRLPTTPMWTEIGLEWVTQRPSYSTYWGRS
ncbi:hypothetical protein HMN09_00183300 [Mycena chlorophos]|uniref:F-box domain-containing protein n=1 Tax=Mycena chlorophos TaxID=658473 RepID=A0A8H6TSJ1_MYCCL|nr:hypothetical protein HMN09_00183300 [Mycena chlorophos]